MTDETSIMTAESPSGGHHAATTRFLGATGITTLPIAVDGCVFGWASGIDETAEVLDAFAGAGGTLISTADHYGGGRSEIMIGTWLRHAGMRERMVVATKIGRHPDASGLSPRSIRRALDNSFERLGVDRIDVLSFDGEDPETPIEESLVAVAPYLADGRVGSLSASLFSGASLARVDAVAREHGLPRFTVCAAEYNLVERSAYETGLAPVVQELGIATLARLPLASGYLTGAFRSKADHPASPMFEGAVKYIGRRGAKVLDALDTVAREVGSSPGAVAIAWLLSRPTIAAAVVRARDGEELRSLFAAQSLPLTRHHLSALDRASA